MKDLESIKETVRLVTGKFITEKRKRERLTQAQLSKKLGVSRSEIGRREGGVNDLAILLQHSETEEEALLQFRKILEKLREN